MGRFHTVEEKDILKGRTTDIYFEHTKKILKNLTMTSMRVQTDFTVSGLPSDYNWAVFCGLEEVINLMAGKKLDLYALPEGTIFQNRSPKGVLVPLMVIDGPYYDFCIYETPILGLICQSSGIATKTSRIKLISKEKQLLSFGIRRIHPSIAYMVDRACYIGGCSSVSCIESAEKLKLTPRGTMPHALTITTGSAEKAFRAFDKHLPKNVPRVALIDTYEDEVAEAIAACETIPDLAGVRLDTPGSRRGNFVKIIQEVRWEMDIRGFESVKIYVSGGINENNVGELVDAGVDGFGIGTTLVNAPVLDIAMDIVEIKGKPVAKRGKFGGRKYVYRCPKCLQMDVLFKQENTLPLCSKCGEQLTEIMKKYISNGHVVQSLPKIDDIKDYVNYQLEQLKMDK
jgi:nicotinate phosphoribosyltransferase